MGSTQSTHAATESSSRNKIIKNVAFEDEIVSGRVTGLSEHDLNQDSDTESEIDKNDEEWNERLTILKDAKNLKTLAEFFLCPEKPVSVDATATARCYFDRPSAPQGETTTESDEVERELIMEDLKQLKKIATDYLHPERTVETTDPCACGRNYFTRFSAPQQQAFEEAEEQAHIIEDSKQLREMATNYLHPEKPVKTSDPFACGRNYFTRPSAPQYADDDFEECIEEERELIMNDTQDLKRLAVDYLCPELPVKTSDPFVCGRNYFNRASAPVQESVAMMNERNQILKEMDQMKTLSTHYLCPEKPVETTDPFACGRNYFTRPSADEYENVSDMDEREDVMEDMRLLKQYAEDYLQPERAVRVNPFASYRNYFTRFSAPQQESLEESEEREQILEDAKQLKKLAVNYLHPEKPVKTTDPYACGRNYFSRPSTLPMQERYIEEEKGKVLEDAKKLKDFAQDFLMPERKVEIDPLAGCRNFFDRPSASAQEPIEFDLERTRILEEMLQMKKLAAFFMFPEKPVEATDPYACGRNYFTRPSAPEQESSEEMEERTRILEEMKQLKKLAVDYLHPELPVKTTDPFATGRNYFSRPSAPQVDPEEEEEREKILSEMKQLKKLAVDYLHPEKPVEVTDSCACGRNYFYRPSAPNDTDMTHTYCEWVDHGYHHVLDHDHHYYWYNQEEISDPHFGMDDEEDGEPHFQFKETTYEVEPFKGDHIVDFVVKETPLSQSPQSVLLLTW